MNAVRNRVGYWIIKFTSNIKIGNQMQNLLCCRKVLNVKFPKIVADKFAFYKISKKGPIFINFGLFQRIFIPPNQCFKF